MSNPCIHAQLGEGGSFRCFVDGSDYIYYALANKDMPNVFGVLRQHRRWTRKLEVVVADIGMTRDTAVRSAIDCALLEQGYDPTEAHYINCADQWLTLEHTAGHTVH